MYYLLSLIHLPRSEPNLWRSDPNATQRSQDNITWACVGYRSDNCFSGVGRVSQRPQTQLRRRGHPRRRSLSGLMQPASEICHSLLFYITRFDAKRLNSIAPRASLPVVLLSRPMPSSRQRDKTAYISSDHDHHLRRPKQRQKTRRSRGRAYMIPEWSTIP